MSLIKIAVATLFVAASAPAFAGGFGGSGFGNVVVGGNYGTYAATGTDYKGVATCNGCTKAKTEGYGIGAAGTTKGLAIAGSTSSQTSTVSGGGRGSESFVGASNGGFATAGTGTGIGGVAGVAGSFGSAPKKSW